MNTEIIKYPEGYPTQYIEGNIEFMGLEFTVNEDVFIPRPETELLVEKTIETIKTTQELNKLNELKILDLCTGSGNIAISLTKFLDNCRIIASDISYQVLCVAKENAKLNLVDKNIDFILSDLFEDLPKTKFDIIVSNPPYIVSSDIAGLQKEISFEPPIALDGGPDGFDFHRKIIKGAAGFLTKGGSLVLEIGFNQAEDIKRLYLENDFINIKFINDYNNIRRIAIAQWID